MEQPSRNSIFRRPLLHSLGVVTYVTIVATFIQNAERLLGRGDTWITGIVFLLLLSVSAAVVGSLTFGYPVVLFLAGHRREGIRAAMITIGWLFLETVIAVSVAIALRA